MIAGINNLGKRGLFPRRCKFHHRSAIRKNNYSNFAAAAVLGVAGILLALSLSHLAAGIALVTGAGPSDGWLMAVGIDLGLIALELAVPASGWEAWHQSASRRAGRWDFKA